MAGTGTLIAVGVVCALWGYAVGLFVALRIMERGR